MNETKGADLNHVLVCKGSVGVRTEERRLARHYCVDFSLLDSSLVCSNTRRAVLSGEAEEAAPANRTVLKAEASLEGRAVGIREPIVGVCVQWEINVGGTITAVGGLHGDAIKRDAELVGLHELGKERVDEGMLAELVEGRKMPNVNDSAKGEILP